MANSQIATTEGAGKNVATYSISETTTKELQRNTLNTSAGVEAGTAASPFQVSLANTATNATPVQVSLANTGANGTAVVVNGSGVTQPVSIATNTPSLIPATSGGLTTYHLVSANSTNQTNIKASAGQVYGWYIYNSNAAARKVAFHNTASTPTAGASILFATVIPPNAGANVEFTNGIAFSSGIAISTVTDLTDAGTTAVGLNDLIINIFYR